MVASICLNFEGRQAKIADDPTGGAGGHEGLDTPLCELLNFILADPNWENIQTAIETQIANDQLAVRPTGGQVDPATIQFFNDRMESLALFKKTCGEARAQILTLSV